ncbi:transmembrane protein, putative [Bodo saltans]|uniref:Transmembrane protein, putative n=1 Tax=Bodo saltans TaxID=75058 RepID=A0A0S4IJX9_BODSA|nr:transmembrane protein, putative [Bodo saltans]|eukprot:CUE61964.1 transmembrane protein, putative [Bodo saltans]
MTVSGVGNDTVQLQWSERIIPAEGAPVMSSYAIIVTIEACNDCLGALMLQHVNALVGGTSEESTTQHQLALRDSSLPTNCTFCFVSKATSSSSQQKEDEWIRWSVKQAFGGVALEWSVVYVNASINAPYTFIQSLTTEPTLPLVPLVGPSLMSSLTALVTMNPSEADTALGTTSNWDVSTSSSSYSAASLCKVTSVRTHVSGAVCASIPVVGSDGFTVESIQHISLTFLPYSLVAGSSGLPSVMISSVNTSTLDNPAMSSFATTTTTSDSGVFSVTSFADGNVRVVTSPSSAALQQHNNNNNISSGYSLTILNETRVVDAGVLLSMLAAATGNRFNFFTSASNVTTLLFTDGSLNILNFTQPNRSTNIVMSANACTITPPVAVAPPPTQRRSEEAAAADQEQRCLLLNSFSVSSLSTSTTTNTSDNTSSSPSPLMTTQWNVTVNRQISISAQIPWSLITEQPTTATPSSSSAERAAAIALVATYSYEAAYVALHAALPLLEHVREQQQQQQQHDQNSGEKPLQYQSTCGVLTPTLSASPSSSALLSCNVTDVLHYSTYGGGILRWNHTIAWEYLSPHVQGSLMHAAPLLVPSVPCRTLYINVSASSSTSSTSSGGPLCSVASPSSSTTSAGDDDVAAVNLTLYPTTPTWGNLYANNPNNLNNDSSSTMHNLTAYGPTMLVVYQNTSRNCLDGVLTLESNASRLLSYFGTIEVNRTALLELNTNDNDVMTRSVLDVVFPVFDSSVGSTTSSSNTMSETPPDRPPALVHAATTTLTSMFTAVALLLNQTSFRSIAASLGFTVNNNDDGPAAPHLWFSTTVVVSTSSESSSSFVSSVFSEIAMFNASSANNNIAFTNNGTTAVVPQMSLHTALRLCSNSRSNTSSLQLSSDASPCLANLFSSPSTSSSTPPPPSSPCTLCLVSNPGSVFITIIATANTAASTISVDIVGAGVEYSPIVLDFSSTERASGLLWSLLVPIPEVWTSLIAQRYLRTTLWKLLDTAALAASPGSPPFALTSMNCSQAPQPLTNVAFCGWYVRNITTAESSVSSSPYTSEWTLVSITSSTTPSSSSIKKKSSDSGLMTSLSSFSSSSTTGAIRATSTTFNLSDPFPFVHSNSQTNSAIANNVAPFPIQSSLQVASWNQTLFYLSVWSNGSFVSLENSEAFAKAVEPALPGLWRDNAATALVRLATSSNGGGGGRGGGGGAALAFTGKSLSPLESSNLTLTEAACDACLVDMFFPASSSSSSTQTRKSCTYPLLALKSLNMLELSITSDETTALRVVLSEVSGWTTVSNSSGSGMAYEVLLNISIGSLAAPVVPLVPDPIALFYFLNFTTKDAPSHQQFSGTSNTTVGVVAFPMGRNCTWSATTTASSLSSYGNGNAMIVRGADTGPTKKTAMCVSATYSFFIAYDGTTISSRCANSSLTPPFNAGVAALNVPLPVLVPLNLSSSSGVGGGAVASFISTRLSSNSVNGGLSVHDLLVLLGVLSPTQTYNVVVSGGDGPSYFLLSNQADFFAALEEPLDAISQDYAPLKINVDTAVAICTIEYADADEVISTAPPRITSISLIATVNMLSVGVKAGDFLMNFSLASSANTCSQCIMNAYAGISPQQQHSAGSSGSSSGGSASDNIAECFTPAYYYDSFAATYFEIVPGLDTVNVNQLLPADNDDGVNTVAVPVASVTFPYFPWFDLTTLPLAVKSLPDVEKHVENMATSKTASYNIIPVNSFCYSYGDEKWTLTWSGGSYNAATNTNDSSVTLTRFEIPSDTNVVDATYPYALASVQTNEGAFLADVHGLVNAFGVVFPDLTLSGVTLGPVSSGSYSTVGVVQLSFFDVNRSTQISFSPSASCTAIAYCGPVTFASSSSGSTSGGGSSKIPAHYASSIVGGSTVHSVLWTGTGAWNVLGFTRVGSVQSLHALLAPEIPSDVEQCGSEANPCRLPCVASTAATCLEAVGQGVAEYIYAFVTTGNTSATVDLGSACAEVPPTPSPTSSSSTTTLSPTPATTTTTTTAPTNHQLSSSPHHLSNIIGSLTNFTAPNNSIVAATVSNFVANPQIRLVCSDDGSTVSMISVPTQPSDQVLLLMQLPSTPTTLNDVITSSLSSLSIGSGNSNGSYFGVAMACTSCVPYLEPSNNPQPVFFLLVSAVKTLAVTLLAFYIARNCTNLVEKIVLHGIGGLTASLARIDPRHRDAFKRRVQSNYLPQRCTNDELRARLTSVIVAFRERYQLVGSGGVRQIGGAVVVDTSSQKFTAGGDMSPPSNPFCILDDEEAFGKFILYYEDNLADDRRRIPREPEPGEVLLASAGRGDEYDGDVYDDMASDYGAAAPAAAAGRGGATTSVAQSSPPPSETGGGRRNYNRRPPTSPPTVVRQQQQQQQRRNDPPQTRKNEGSPLIANNSSGARPAPSSEKARQPQPPSRRAASPPPSEATRPKRSAGGGARTGSPPTRYNDLDYDDPRYQTNSRRYGAATTNNDDDDGEDDAYWCHEDVIVALGTISEMIAARELLRRRRRKHVLQRLASSSASTRNKKRKQQQAQQQQQITTADDDPDYLDVVAHHTQQPSGDDVAASAKPSFTGSLNDEDDASDTDGTGGGDVAAADNDNKAEQQQILSQRMLRETEEAEDEQVNDSARRLAKLKAAGKKSTPEASTAANVKPSNMSLVEMATPKGGASPAHPLLGAEHHHPYLDPITGAAAGGGTSWREVVSGRLAAASPTLGRRQDNNGQAPRTPEGRVDGVRSLAASGGDDDTAALRVLEEALATETVLANQLFDDDPVSFERVLLTSRLLDDALTPVSWILFLDGVYCIVLFFVSLVAALHLKQKQPSMSHWVVYEVFYFKLLNSSASASFVVSAWVACTLQRQPLRSNKMFLLSIMLIAPPLVTHVVPGIFVFAPLLLLPLVMSIAFEFWTRRRYAVHYNNSSTTATASGGGSSDSNDDGGSASREQSPVSAAGAAAGDGSRDENLGGGGGVVSAGTLITTADGSGEEGQGGSNKSPSYTDAGGTADSSGGVVATTTGQEERQQLIRSFAVRALSRVLVNFITAVALSMSFNLAILYIYHKGEAGNPTGYFDVIGVEFTSRDLVCTLNSLGNGLANILQSLSAVGPALF